MWRFTSKLSNTSRRAAISRILGAVSAASVAGANSLSQSEVAADRQIESQNRKQGPVGQRGSSKRGPTGPTGPSGSGVVGAIVERTAMHSGDTLGPYATGTLSVDCLAGEVPISGGYFGLPTFGFEFVSGDVVRMIGIPLLITENRKTTNGWKIKYKNPTGNLYDEMQDFGISVICMQV